MYRTVHMKFIINVTVLKNVNGSITQLLVHHQYKIIWFDTITSIYNKNILMADRSQPAKIRIQLRLQIILVTVL